MIDINLIPLSLRKNGDDNAAMTINIPKEILIGVGASLIVLMVTVHLILGVLWLMTSGHLARVNMEWQKVLPEKTALDAIHKESGDLKKKIDTISNMTTKKSPKFNAISDSLARGLWIRRMTLDKDGLTIEGSVVSKTQSEINNVGLFLSALKQEADFMKDFASLEVNSIQGGKSDSVAVTDFSVMAKLK